MPTGGIKIGSEINLGSFVGTELSNGAVTITKTTNTFTPTSRLELEQMFLEASEGQEMYKNAAGFAPPPVTTTQVGGRTYVNLDTKCWQGGSTTVVTPTSSIPTFMMGGNGEIHPQGSEVPERKVNRGGGRKPMKVEEDEDLSPEERERRDQRRERNKQAAARCRKRRMDQTMTLQEEVDQWEEKKKALTEEIQALQTQKEELKFILDAHQNMCKRNKPQQFTLPETQVAVKVEPMSEFLNGVMEDVNEVHSTTMATTSTVGKASRPVSLNLGVKSNCVRSIEGIAIDTPTNVFTSLNFESLMEGRSGLTPTNILTPVSISFNGALNTPSCSSQQRNGYETGTPDTISPKLVSL